MRLAHEAAVYFPIGNLALSGSMPCAGGITFFHDHASKGGFM